MLFQNFLPAADNAARPQHHCGLPPRLRLLWVGPEEPSWVSLALQLDAEACLEPQFQWISTATEALALLRRESFDCILIGQGHAESAEFLPLEDPLSLLGAIRASGCDEPVVLVATALDDRQWAAACHNNCEVLITQDLWESRALVPVIKRALLSAELLRENRRLAVANQRRLVRERDEAEHLLNQQRQIVRELERLAQSVHEPAGSPAAGAVNEGPLPSRPPSFRLPAEIERYYHELLRTYVIMGSGNLGGEIAPLAELLAAAELTPREALTLHLEQVEDLVRGLGNRSTRHVMARADLLALELMIHLGESYQRRTHAND